MVAASRWLHDVYDKVMALMPPELASRLAPAEVFHEVLEHRWFLSEQAGRDIGTTAAARSYFENVLPSAPAQLVSLPPGEALPGSVRTRGRGASPMSSRHWAALRCRRRAGAGAATGSGGNGPAASAPVRCRMWRKERRPPPPTGTV